MTYAWAMDVPFIDSGLYSDPRTGDRVASTGLCPSTYGYADLDEYNPLHFGYFRNIAGGTRVIGDNRAMTGNILNAAPIGLGYLALCGYLGDLRTFFCPSVGGEMRVMQRTQPDKNAGMVWNKAGVVDSPKEVQALGGFEPRYLTHGDHYRATNNNNFFYLTGMGRNNCGILSHYSYRNVPISTSNDGYGPWTSVQYWIPGIRPKIFINGVIWTGTTNVWSPGTVGTPMLKTQKLLGNRSIVADAFDRRPEDQSDPLAGLGYDAHRDGYNVLYGDWSARWYGDPSQYIMYANPPNLPNRTITAGQWGNYGSFLSDHPQLHGGTGGSSVEQAQSLGFIVWQLFDKDHGEDAASPIPDPRF